MRHWSLAAGRAVTHCRPRLIAEREAAGRLFSLAHRGHDDSSGRDTPAPR